MGETGREQTADGFVGGTIENLLHNIKRTRPRKGSLFIDNYVEVGGPAYPQTRISATINQIEVRPDGDWMQHARI